MQNRMEGFARARRSETKRYEDRVHFVNVTDEDASMDVSRYAIRSY